jgi:hypothetical protein
MESDELPRQLGEDDEPPDEFGSRIGDTLTFGSGSYIRAISADEACRRLAPRKLTDLDASEIDKALAFAKGYMTATGELGPEPGSLLDSQPRRRGLNRLIPTGPQPRCPRAHAGADGMSGGRPGRVIDCKMLCCYSVGQDDWLMVTTHSCGVVATLWGSAAGRQWARRRAGAGSLASTSIAGRVLATGSTSVARSRRSRSLVIDASSVSAVTRAACATITWRRCPGATVAYPGAKAKPQNRQRKPWLGWTSCTSSSSRSHDPQRAWMLIGSPP